MTTLLEMRQVTKVYGGAPAVKAVDFDLREGEIHALVGENGAGKSTLTKLMAGAVQPTSGTMLYRGAEVAFASPWEAIKAGITMVFQETSLVPSLTVAQNLYLGDERFFNRLRGITIAAQQFLQSLNFSVDPTALVAANPELRRVLEMIRTGFFSMDAPDRFTPIVDALTTYGDHFMLVADYPSYIACQDAVDALYLNEEEWSRRAILNVAGMGRFSSDRTIQEYASNVWGVTSVTRG